MGFLARCLWRALVLLCLWPASLLAESVTLPVDGGRASLAGHLARLVDPRHELSLDDVLRADAAGQFEPLREFRPAGHTSDVHWYRFTLSRPAGAPSDWIVELGEAYIDHIDAYVETASVETASVEKASVEKAGGFRLVRLGDHVPFSERPLKTRLHAFMLNLPDDRPVRIYLRIDSISAIVLSGTVWTPAAFMAEETRSLLLHGVFFGALGLIVLLYFALAVAMGDGALTAYSGYVATLFLYYLGANGVGAVWLPDLPGWALNLLTGGSGLAGAAVAMIMWDRLLNLRQTFPRIGRAYRGLAVLEALTIPSAAFPIYAVTNKLVIGSAVLTGLVSLGIVVVLMRRDRSNVSLRYYLAAFLVAIAGLVSSNLALRDLLPASGVLIHSYQAAYLIHLVILALGLSHRVRQLQEERIRALQEIGFARHRAEQQRSFVAMLSHEFRTPLASIDSAAQMVAATAGPLPETAQRRLARIRATAGRLGELVDLFLSSDALDQGALALKPEPVPLSRIVALGLQELAEAELASRVTVAGPADDQVIRVDPQFLGVALANLVRNALRYSPPESAVEVRVEAAADPGGGDVSIIVRDQGYGMSAEEVGRIGSMYFRAGSSTGTKGAGIGLYITRQIVAAHGGTLEVESAVGKGSVFTIRIPAGGTTPTAR